MDLKTNPKTKCPKKRKTRNDNYKRITCYLFEILDCTELKWEYLYQWEHQNNVGIVMTKTCVKVDKKGRVHVPQQIRKTANIKEGSYVNIKIDGNVIIIEPTEPVADKYYGAFKITQWPEDLDQFNTDVIHKWWTTHDT